MNVDSADPNNPGVVYSNYDKQPLRWSRQPFSQPSASDHWSWNAKSNNNGKSASTSMKLNRQATDGDWGKDYTRGGW